QGGGGFLSAQARETAERDELRFSLVVGSQTLDRLVEGDNIFHRTGQRHIEVIDIHTLFVAATLQTFFSSRLINQHLPHGLGGGGEEMPATVPARVAIADQFHVGLVYQGR